LLLFTERLKTALQASDSSITSYRRLLADCGGCENSGDLTLETMFFEKVYPDDIRALARTSS
jgi:hypothetical protein